MGDVIAHGTLRFGGVASHDRPGDQVMIEKSFWDYVRRELENTEGSDSLTEATRYICNTFVMGSLVDKFVKLFIEVDEWRVLLNNGLSQCFIEDLYPPPFQRGHSLRAKTGT